jgi:chromatin segregation and condensation protein Rec8/ScpA/Scc1 (kleisin family)
LGLTLKLTHYEGSLEELVSRIRSRRLDPLNIDAHQMVTQCRTGWKDAVSVDEVADDLPKAAWVLHRKGQSVLPGAIEVEEPEPVAEDAEPWVRPAALLLRAYFETVPQGSGGAPRWPDALPRPPRDATPYRLAMAWPPGRPRREDPPPALVVPPEALWRRGLSLVRRLRARPHTTGWEELVAGQDIAGRVETFGILMALWARQRVELRQSVPFGPLTVVRTEREGRN